MNEHDAAKEFATGMLTSMRTEPKAIARAMVEHCAEAFKKRGETLTADMVHAIAGGQMEIAHELQRYADAIAGTALPRGPQLATLGQPLPPCPICKTAMSTEDRRGFRMIHAHCAPKS